MKKLKKNLPEVHILGDLKDVKNLISGVNKKKTLVVFKDGEEGSHYLEIEGKFQPILQKDISLLSNEYRLIFFSFFPGRKKVEPESGEQPEVKIPAKKVKKEEGTGKAKKDKKGNKKK